MNRKTCRGIKDLMFWQSLVSGKLSNMIEVVKADPELVLHFRNNYLNVYYHSGNIAKITSERGLIIDENYFISCDEENYIRNPKKQTPEDKMRHEKLIERRDKFKKLFYEGKYVEYFSEMKETMQKYWKYYPSKNNEDEGDVQQELCVKNQFESTESEFTIIDLEHEVSVNADFCYKGTTPFPKKAKDGTFLKKEKPRFDIVAVRKKTGQLYVMELKKGTGALYGTSGMHDHVDSFEHTIRENKEAESSFIEEIEYILMQKQIMGLIDKRVKISHDEVQFAFVYSFSDNDRSTRKLEKAEVEYLSKQEIKGIKIADYPIIYLRPDQYTLKCS